MSEKKAAKLPKELSHLPPNYFEQLKKVHEKRKQEPVKERRR